MCDRYYALERKDKPDTAGKNAKINTEKREVGKKEKAIEKANVASSKQLKHTRAITHRTSGHKAPPITSEQKMQSNLNCTKIGGDATDNQKNI